MATTTLDIAKSFETFLFDPPSFDEREALRALAAESSTSVVDRIKTLIICMIARDVAGPHVDGSELETLRSLVRREPTVEFNAWLDFFQGRSSEDRSEVQDSILFYRRVLSNADASVRRIHIPTYYFLGGIYYEQGVDDEAMNAYQECLRLAREQDNRFYLRYVLSRLVEINNTNGRFATALELAEEAIEISKSEKEPLGEPRFRSMRCTTLIELGQGDLVLEYLGPLRDELLASKQTFQLSTIELMLGKIYRLKKEYAKSREHIEVAVADYRYREKTFLLGHALLHLSELLIEIGANAEARATLEEVALITKTIPNSYLVASLQEVTINLLQAEGKYQEALLEYRGFFEAKQRAVSEQAERRMMMTRIEHEIYRKEQEAQQYRLKSEQLQTELMIKTGHLVKQAETLQRFGSDVRKILSEATDPIVGLRKVREKVRELSGGSMDWEEYDKTFSEVHPEFKQRLIVQFPTLTPMETKVCTLLRIELTSKEIANLLNISDRSVENHRYRARKKIGLSENENIHQFLSSI